MARGRTGLVLLLLLVAINLVNGTLLAILIPTWLGADEYTHYGYIQYLRTHGSLPDQRTCRFSQELETSVYEADWWRLSGNMGKVGRGPERFYAHGFLQFAPAGTCSIDRDEAHSGSCSMALNYRFHRGRPEALGVYLSPLDITSFDAIGLWLCGDGSAQEFELAIDTPPRRSHKFRIPLNFSGFRKVVAPFSKFSGDLLRDRCKGAMLKISITNALAGAKSQSGTVLVDDIWFENHGRKVILTGFEPGELLDRDATRFNWAAHHPPLYYLLGLPIEWALRHRPIFTRAFALRLFSLLLSTVTVVIAAMIGRMLFGTDDSAEWLLLPCVMVLSPAFSVHQVCINNDQLLILLYTLLLYLLLKWQDKPVSAKRAVVLGLICGLGMLTKMLFITAFIVIAVYLVLNAKRSRQSLRSLFRTFAIVVAASLAVCGWWFIRNVMVYGRLLITATTYLSAKHLPVEMTPLDFFLSKKFLGWIGAGWLTLRNSHTDLLLAILVLGVSAAGYVKTLLLWLWRNQPLFTPGLFAKFRLLFYALLIHVSAVLFVVSTGSIKVGRFRALHGRYFFPVIVAIAAIWALGVCKLLPQKNRNQFVATVVAILIALEASNVYVTAITHWYPF